MKISRLLALSALGLFSLSVNAADLIERTAPEAPATAPVFGESVDVSDIVRTPVAFEAGKIYVLYNVGTEKFFSQGCNWATQACVADLPLAVRFTVPEGKTLADAALLMTDYNLFTKKWDQVFYDSPTAMFTDRGSQEISYFQLVEQGGNTYRIMASPANKTYNPNDYPGFIGRDDERTESGDLHGRDVGTSDALMLSPFLEEGEGHHLDWQLFAVTGFEEWDTYFTDQIVYNKSEQLKTVILKAEENGIDISSAEAVYNDETSTADQMQAAIDALQAALAGGIESGTAENPSDATSVINNPDFDNASSAGWSGSTPNMKGSGAHGPANVAEFYEGNNVDMYQELSGIPAGVYRLTMYGLYRSGNTGAAYQNYLDNANYRAKLYATVDGEMLTADIVNPFEIQNKESYAGATDWGVNAAEASSNGFNIPNDPSCARVYFNQGWYQNTLFFYVSADKAIIGVREDGTHLATDWFPFDEFRLTYFGNTEASFGKWVELSAPDFSNWKVTASLLDDFQSSLEGLIASATDKASALDGVEQLKPLVDELKANAALWAKYQSKIEEGKALSVDVEFEAFAGELADYCDMDAEDHLNDLDLTSEELEAEIAKIDQMIIDVQKAAGEANVLPGTVVTKTWFKNCDFASGNEGWTISKGSCNFRVGIAEAYGVEFDIHQDHAPAKKGVYRLDLQGFFRTARNNESLASYLEGTQTCDAAVYLGTADATNRTKVKCVFAEQISDEDRGEASGFGPDSGDWSDGNYYANTMEAANVAFQAGMYKNSAYGIVKNEDETIRIGVGGKLGGNDWICWDNFVLTYLGYEDAEANAYLIGLAIQDLNEMDLTKPMGKTVKADKDATIAAANAAIASGDGAKMFDALSDLYDVKARIEASIALFAELNQLIEDVTYAYQNNTDNLEAVAAAGNAVQDIQEGMDNGIYDDADVPALKALLQRVRTALFLPDLTNIPSEGVDVTAVIVSADYGNEELMSTNPDTGEVDDLGNRNIGWDGDTGNFGNDDTQKGAYAYEFYNKTFNHSQTIYGMPAGKYEVEVYAFNRYGTNGQDFKAREEGVENTAYLFAEGNGTENKVVLPFITDGAETYSLGIDGEATLMFDAEGNETSDAGAAVGETYYMPGNMLSSVSFFDMDKYLNKIEVTVGEDGILCIGIKKTENQEGGWCIIDSWKLTYFGGGEDVSSPCDLDGNGKVNALDIQTIINACVDSSTDSKFDINKDGKVNALDIQEVINTAAASARRLGIIID